MKAENEAGYADLDGKLTRAVDLAADLRAVLLEAARDAGMTGGEMWRQAESLLGLAKNADVLRQSIGAISVAPADNQKVVPLQATATTPVIATNRVHKNKVDYPKYSVRGDDLVKIGLGRDRRTEYEHFVPKTEFDKILQRIAGHAGVKKCFRAEYVQQGLDCPSYQTYIILGLLRDRGHILSERRGEYSFKSAKTFASDASGLWNELSAAHP
jgi:hypothetical protein